MTGAKRRAGQDRTQDRRTTNGRTILEGGEQVLTWDDVLHKFVSTVDHFYELTKEIGKPMYMETKGGEYLNFKPASFRTALEQNGVENDHVEFYMKLYKNLGWLIAEDGKFTNAQRINNKVMRVVTVKYSAYKTLKDLKRNEKA